jgi:chromate reductase, NAD(P)H dehydrogenase (quinone)
MAKLRLGIIVGSTRRDSINRKFAQALAKLGANAFDATFLKIDDLPLYNQDNEQPVPDAVARFKREVAASDALLFVTPEHSRSIPAALKNAIDWGGRPYGTSVWPGKPAAVIGASPGAISTAIAQNHLRSVLGTFSGMHVMGGEAYIQFKPDTLDANNNVPDENVRKFLQAFVDQFASFAARLAPERKRAAA